MKQLRIQLALVWLVSLCPALRAQTPFWTEDFSNGIPNNWTNEDGSGQGVTWSWCSDPDADDLDCPPVFQGQQPFMASTATTGFVNVNSDKAGQLAAPHLARLTSPAIDCSGRNKVFVRMETFIGVYATSAETGAVLRVSTDKINWTRYTIFPGLTPQVTWSANPALPIIDISDKAANQPVVYLQWEWKGNYEYIWNLDDVGVYAENPTPRNDVAISNYIFPAASYSTPASQIASDTFAFGAYLTNKGLHHATNLIFKAAVLNEQGATLFADSLFIPSLSLGVSDSFFVLPNRFVPALSQGTYHVAYSVRFDSIDQRPVDNLVSSTFVVSDKVFAKENNPEITLRPSQPGNWAVGNYYRMSPNTLEHYKAMRVEFAYGTNPANLQMSEVTAPVYLFKLTDEVKEDFSNFDDGDIFSSSFEFVALTNYVAPDSLSQCQLQSVDLMDLNTGQLGAALDPGGRYFLVVIYEDGSSNAYHCFSDDVPTTPVSTVIYRGQWYLGGFTGDKDNAVIRMFIDLVTTADETPLPSQTLAIFPNPVQGRLNLKVQFEHPTDATITLAETSGRVIQMEDRQGLTEEQLSYELPNLAPGTYLARIATKTGTLTKKFVVTL